ncbi:MAG: FG-GAP-like repeat-containing protein [Bryobacteraceae bacterium]
MQIKCVSFVLCLLFAASLSAQSCLTFTGLEFATLYNGSTIGGLLHQSDGSYTEILGTAHSPYSIQNVVANFDRWINSCASPPMSLTLPSVSATGTPLGSASDVVTFADFTNSFIPGTAFAANPSPQPQISVGTITGGAAHLNTYAVPAGAATVAAADFNKDGIMDLAVVYTGALTASGQTAGGVAILLGNGDGTFQSAVSYPAGPNALHTAIADLNGDGKLDLAVAADSGSVTVLLGNGDGTFKPGATITTGLGYGPAAVIAADFNGDGKLDLATSNEDGSISILTGNGDGTFKTPQNFAAGRDCAYLASADLNKDGKLDIVATNLDAGVIAVLLGKGDGTFQPPTFYNATFFPNNLILTDFNHDGNIDIVIGSGSSDIIAPDFGSGEVGVLLGNGDGTFQGMLYPTGQRPQAIAAGDLNRDGKPDLVVANTGSDSLTLLLNQGSGKFSTSNYPLTQSNGNPVGPASVAIVDLNGDGNPDVAVADESAGNVAIALGSSSGTLQPTTYVTTAPGAASVAAGDLNGDGKPDLVVANAGTYTSGGNANGELSILIGNGDGTFKAASNIAAGVQPGFVVLADVNGDHKLDMVVVNLGLTAGFSAPPDPGGVTIMLGNGDGTFQKAVNYAVGINPTAAAVGDINGDGKPDLVVTTSQPNFSYVVGVLLGNGDGTFQNPAFLTGQFTMPNVILSDFNGDGKLDIVVTSCCGDTQPSYFVGNGDGTFQSAVALNGGPSAYAVVAADFNADGKPDLAFADQGSNSGYVTVLLNTSQVSAFLTKSATDGQIEPFAAESIVAAYGSNLAVGTAVATGPLGTTLDGTTVTITDSAGVTRPALLFYVSSTQVNYEIPAGSAPGTATVTITSGSGAVQTATIQIGSVSPGLFALNGSGLVAALVLPVVSGTQQPLQQVYQVNTSGSVVPLPIDLGPSNEQIYLEMYGTGIRAAKTVTVTVGNLNVPVLYSGLAPGYAGEDQVNIGPLPPALAGSGNVNIVLTADGQTANLVNVTIK